MTNLPRWKCKNCNRLISQKKQVISDYCFKCKHKLNNPNMVSLDLTHETYYEFEKFKVEDTINRCNECDYEMDVEDTICPRCTKTKGE